MLLSLVLFVVLPPPASAGRLNVTVIAHDPSGSLIGKIYQLMARQHDERMKGAFRAFGGEDSFRSDVAKALAEGADPDFVRTVYCKARTGFYQWHVLDETDRHFVVKEWVDKDDIMFVAAGIVPPGEGKVDGTPLNLWPKHELGNATHPSLVVSPCSQDARGDPGCELPEADPDCEGLRSPGEVFRLKFFDNVLAGEKSVGSWHIQQSPFVKTHGGFYEKIVLTEPVERKKRKICCCPGFGVGMKPQGTSHWPDLFQGDFARRDFFKKDIEYLKDKYGERWCHMERIPAGEKELTCSVSRRGGLKSLNPLKKEFFRIEWADEDINWEPVLVGPDVHPHLVADAESCESINALFFMRPSEETLQGHAQDLKGLAMMTFGSESYHRRKTELHARNAVWEVDRRPLQIMFRPMEVGPNAKGALKWISVKDLLEPNQDLKTNSSKILQLSPESLMG